MKKTACSLIATLVVLLNSQLLLADQSDNKKIHSEQNWGDWCCVQVRLHPLCNGR